jgi:hypothetical protein
MATCNTCLSYLKNVNNIFRARYFHRHKLRASTVSSWAGSNRSLTTILAHMRTDNVAETITTHGFKGHQNLYIYF